MRNLFENILKNQFKEKLEANTSLNCSHGKEN
jgi:hypothetical protein